MSRSSRFLLLGVLTLGILTITQGALADPFLIDTGYVHVPLDSSAESPAVAFDGTNYLAVWQDRREGNWNTYATRVAQTGEVMEPSGIPVCTVANDQVNPAVAFDGSNFFVVWEDRRSGWRWDIYGARVSPSGQVLDPDGFLVRSQNGDKHSPQVVFGHGRFLVTWDEYCGDRNVVAAFVDPSGQVQEAFEVSVGFGNQAAPAAAVTAEGFVIAWQDGRNGSWPQVYCSRVDSFGVVLDTAGVHLWPDRYSQERPSVSWDGGNTLVVWEESALIEVDIYGLRVNPAGVVLDTVPICVSVAAGRQFRPRVRFRDHDWFVVWEDNRWSDTTAQNVYGARVAPDGTVLDPFGLPLVTTSGAQCCPTFCPADTQSLIVWHGSTSDSVPPGVWATRLTEHNQVVDPGGFRLASQPYYYSQFRPSIAFNGTCYLAVWTDDRHAFLSPGIYGMRVSAGGISLDSAAIQIAEASGCQDSVSVASDGENFLVAWQSARAGNWDIYAARVGPDGIRLDSTDVLISGTQHEAVNPAVTYDGTNFLVAWQEARGSWGVYGARIAPSGILLDTSAIPISMAAASYSPAVCGGDSVSLVAWQCYSVGFMDILATRITASGVVLDSPPICVSHMDSSACNPSVACNGQDYLVTWQARWANRGSIYGARVSLSGVLLDSQAVAVCVTPDWEDHPSACFDGRDFYVVCETRADTWFSVRGARLNHMATVMDSFTLVAQLRERCPPDLAAGSGGQILMVYSAFTDSIGGNHAAASRIWGLFSPFGGIGENGRGVVAGSRFDACPNPFSDMVRFQLPVGKHDTHLLVWDAAGRLVRDLSDSQGPPCCWDGTDNSGRRLPRGVYFVTFNTTDRAERQKLVKLQ